MLNDISIMNIAGCFLGFIGIVLSVYFYFKGRRIRRLSYSMRSFNLISDSLSSLPEFKAIYKGGRN